MLVHLSVPLTELLTRYEKEYLQFRKRESKVNRHRLVKLNTHFSNSDTIEHADVGQFFLRFPHWSPSTRNRYRALLQNALRWGQEMGLVTSDSLISFKKEQEFNQRTNRITKEEENKLVAKLGPEMQAMFYAALDTGLRKGALLKLTLKDVRDGKLYVPGDIQKHGQSQIIPLTERMRTIILRLTTRGVPSGTTLFKWSEREWKRAKEKIGRKDLHFHDLRGEFASRLDEAGVSVVVTSQLLGHSSLAMTQKYLRPRVERFQEAIDRLGV